MPEEKTTSSGNGKAVIEYDDARGLVKVGDKWLPTSPCTGNTVLRHIQREYGTEPAPKDALIERFAGSLDDEDDVAWGEAKLKAAMNQTVGDDPCLIDMRAYGRIGGGKIVSYRVVPANHPVALDQTLDRAQRAQRQQIKAGARYERLRESLKKHGIDIA
jgi:hypothetical protein